MNLDNQILLDDDGVDKEEGEFRLEVELLELPCDEEGDDVNGSSCRIICDNGHNKDDDKLVAVAPPPLKRRFLLLLLDVTVEELAFLDNDDDGTTR